MNTQIVEKSSSSAVEWDTASLKQMKSSESVLSETNVCGCGCGCGCSCIA